MNDLYWYSRSKDFIKLNNEHKRLLKAYFTKPFLSSCNQKIKEGIESDIEDFYNIYLLIKKIRDIKSNLEDEINKLLSINENLLSSQRLTNDDEHGTAIIEVIKRNNQLINDLISLKKERIKVDNLTQILDKYKTLNTVVILSFYTQSISYKQVLAELVNLIVAILTSKNGGNLLNNKSTKLTSLTRELVNNIFTINEDGYITDSQQNVSDRELKKYKTTSFTNSLLHSLYK